MNEMTCRDLIGFLSDYLDGSLAKTESSAFDEHLEVCEACRNYLKTYQQSIVLSREALCEEEELPPEVAEAILAALKAART